MSQKDTILSLCWNKWAGPRQFMQAGIARYHPRLDELKKDGWEFEEKIARQFQINKHGKRVVHKKWKAHRMIANKNGIMVAEYYSAKKGKK